MFDGVVQTLTRVRHVLGLKRNLISLGTLHAKGYRYSSQGGGLNVSKGAVVVLNGEMSRGLYKLVGNVQTVGAAGRTTRSDSSERQVARRKWRTFVSSARGYDDLSEPS